MKNALIFLSFKKHQQPLRAGKEKLSLLSEAFLEFCRHDFIVHMVTTATRPERLQKSYFNVDVCPIVI